MDDAHLAKWRTWYETSMSGNPNPQPFEEFWEEQIALRRAEAQRPAYAVGEPLPRPTPLKRPEWLKPSKVKPQPAPVKKGMEPDVHARPNRFPDIATEPDEKVILTKLDPIIEGLLEPGDKMSLSSGSKCFKTWTLIQLGLCVGAGEPWLDFTTRKTRVLFLNFEIKPVNFWKRVFKIRRALGLEKGKDFAVWNLRGCGFSMDSHADELIKRAADMSAGVIILDPIYKLFGDRNESSAGDMATLMALFDKVATATGAAIVYAHHFAKGNAAAKDPMDRASGSGVFARDPDCLITVSRAAESEGENAFSMEITLRDFAPVEKFGVRRVHPLMIRADDVNPANLHEPGKRTPKYSSKQLVELLPPEGLSVTAWKRAAKESLGMAASTFYDWVPGAKKMAENRDNLWFKKAA